MYDIHNQDRKVKGSFTHSFKHECGQPFVLKHERNLVDFTISVIEKMDVSLVIELGTYRGGFTKLLEDRLPEADIHTFDNVNQSAGGRKYFGSHVHFYIRNVLTDCVDLNDLIKRPEQKLLYCDNGNKKKEVELYSRMLNKGDFIGVHDWGNEIFWNDVKEYIGNWERFEWRALEAVGVTSRFWRK